MGKHINEDDLRGMIDEFDKNKDGFIDENEFIQLMEENSFWIAEHYSNISVSTLVVNSGIRMP